MKKCGRNDPCPCGSGKKFKKCCEATMLGGRFKATKVDVEAGQAAVSKLAGLFHSRVTAAPAPTSEPKPIKPSLPPQIPVEATQVKQDEEGKAGE